MTDHAWTWSMPVSVRLAAGLVLFTMIGILLTAARGSHYRRARIVAGVGCAGLVGLDLGLLAVVAAAAWPLMLAVPASSARLIFTADALEPVISG